MKLKNAYMCTYRLKSLRCEAISGITTLP